MLTRETMRAELDPRAGADDAPVTFRRANAFAADKTGPSIDHIADVIRSAARNAATSARVLRLAGSCDSGHADPTSRNDPEHRTEDNWEV